MATIQNAVKVMVDKLVADMSGETPLNAEEQALVTTAISKLSDNAKLESAIVAVAEEHIEEAKSILYTATQAAQAASTELVQNADNLSLLPDIKSGMTDSTIDLTNNMNDKIGNLPALLGAPQYRYGEPNFILDYYDNTCIELHSTGVNNSYGARNAISLVDYVTGQFFAYWDAGSQTNGNNPAILLKIDDKGEISKVSKSTQLVSSTGADSLMLLRLDDGSVCAAAFDTTHKRISVYESMSFQVKLTQDLDYLKIYQDPETHHIYAVNAELLHVLTGNSSEWKRMETRFVNEAAFNTWGQQQGYIDISSLSLKPRNNSTNGIGSSTGYTSSLAYLPITRPGYYVEMAYTSEGIKAVSRTKAQQLARFSAEIFNSHTYSFTRTFSSRIELKSYEGRFSAVLESRTPTNTAGVTSSYNNHFYPHLVVYSPIHRALIVEQRFYFYYNGGNVRTHTRNRVYFA